MPISLTVEVSGTPTSGNSPVFFFDDDVADAQGPSPSGENGNGNAEQGATGDKGAAGGTTVAAEDDDSLAGELALPRSASSRRQLCGVMLVWQSPYGPRPY
ncbi:hypothetical protein ACFU5Y_24185 [Streptomyces gardneri]|uniref:hypothetical protein n=1 Tax=Streptomyces gardneri TaxID=66892 RepID=UPI0036B4B092